MNIKNRLRGFVLQRGQSAVPPSNCKSTGSAPRERPAAALRLCGPARGNRITLHYGPGSTYSWVWNKVKSGLMVGLARSPIFSRFPRIPWYQGVRSLETEAGCFDSTLTYIVDPSVDASVLSCLRMFEYMLVSYAGVPFASFRRIPLLTRVSAEAHSSSKTLPNLSIVGVSIWSYQPFCRRASPFSI